MCVFVFDPPPRQDVQADGQKFASAVAPGICLICPLITRQVAFLQRTWAAISFLRERDTHDRGRERERLKGEKQQQKKKTNEDQGGFNNSEGRRE